MEYLYRQANYFPSTTPYLLAFNTFIHWRAVKLKIWPSKYSLSMGQTRPTLKKIKAIYPKYTAILILVKAFEML